MHTFPLPCSIFIPIFIAPAVLYYSCPLPLARAVHIIPASLRGQRLAQAMPGSAQRPAPRGASRRSAEGTRRSAAEAWPAPGKGYYPLICANPVLVSNTLHISGICQIWSIQAERSKILPHIRGDCFAAILRLRSLRSLRSGRRLAMTHEMFEMVLTRQICANPH